MGMFDTLFGKKKINANFRDGQWLESEQDGTWAIAYEFDSKRQAEAVLTPQYL